jgi:hypothetical protein
MPGHWPRGDRLGALSMTPATRSTLREFREYCAVTYEANRKIAARVGVTAKTFANWLTGDHQPNGQVIGKARGLARVAVHRVAVTCTKMSGAGMSKPSSGCWRAGAIRQSAYRPRSTGPVSLKRRGLLCFLIFDYFFCPWLRNNRRPVLR